MNKKSLLVTALAVFALTAFSTASVFVASADEVEAGKKLEDRPDKEELEEMREEIEAVMDSGDYDAWIDLMIDMGRDEVIDEVTEDEFPQLLEAHELMGEARELMEEARGVMSEAGDIMSEIGLEMPEGKGMKGKHGMRGMHGEGDALPTE